MASNYETFLERKLPIILIMGPPFCGKTTIGEMLRTCSKFSLIKLKDLFIDEAQKNTVLGDKIGNFILQGKPVPDKTIVKLLRQEIISSFINVQGYIIDGFPQNLNQALLFKYKLVAPNAIVYMTMRLDSLLARMICKNGDVDMNSARINHIKHSRKLHEIATKFEPQTIKMYASYPPEHTCNRLVEQLEDYYGFKFMRIST